MREMRQYIGRKKVFRNIIMTDHRKLKSLYYTISEKILQIAPLFIRYPPYNGTLGRVLTREGDTCKIILTDISGV
jgi:hypothetical protein